MSVAGILSSSLSQGSAIAQFLTDFKQLGEDLSNGNLNASQQDFVTLSQDVQIPSTTTTAASSTSTQASTATTGSQSLESELEAAFQTLGQDFQSGNLSGAQQTFAQIQKDLQGGSGQDVQHGGGHHGHHHSEGSSLLSVLQQAVQSLSNNSSSSTSSSSSTGTSGTTTGSTTTSSSGTTTTASGSSGSGSSSNSTSPLAALGQAFEAVGSALESGNLSSAQQAFTQFTQDLLALPDGQGNQQGGDFGGFSGFDNSGFGFGGFNPAGAELYQAFAASLSSGTSSSSSTTSTQNGSSLNVSA